MHESCVGTARVKPVPCISTMGDTEGQTLDTVEYIRWSTLGLTAYFDECYMKPLSESGFMEEAPWADRG